MPRTNVPDWPPPSDRVEAAPPRRGAILTAAAAAAPLLAILSGPGLLVLELTSPAATGQLEDLILRPTRLFLMILGPFLFSAAAYAAGTCCLKPPRALSRTLRCCAEWGQALGIAGMLTAGLLWTPATAVVWWWRIYGPDRL